MDVMDQEREEGDDGEAPHSLADADAPALPSPSRRVKVLKVIHTMSMQNQKYAFTAFQKIPSGIPPLHRYIPNQTIFSRVWENTPSEQSVVAIKCFTARQL